MCSDALSIFTIQAQELQTRKSNALTMGEKLLQKGSSKITSSG